MLFQTIIHPFLMSIFLFLFGRFLGIMGCRILIILSSIYSLFLISYLISYLDSHYSFLFNYSIDYFCWDSINLSMTLLILFLSIFIHFYSFWYLSSEPFSILFHSLLYSFSAFMILFVSSNHLFFFFLGWEGIGLFSFFLINFWSSSIFNNSSALQAILYNKFGDIFLFLYIISFLSCYDSFSLIPFNLLSSSMGLFFLFLASFVKSAQFLFHSWLGSAMAGPTPVSALLHAATMVTAGILLSLKFHIQPPFFLIALCIFFFSIYSFFQSDIKKLIAYSTASQIAFMFLSISDFSFFHLFNHAFFKSLLFLLAGFFIHLSFSQDLRSFGGLLSFFPLAYSFFLLSSLSLSGFFFLSGFFSKDLLLLSFSSSPFFFLVFLASFFSSFYSFKLLFSLFFLPPNSSLSIYKSFSFEPSFLLFLFPLAFASLFSGSFSSSFFIPFFPISEYLSLVVSPSLFKLMIPGIGCYSLILYSFFIYLNCSTILNHLRMVLEDSVFLKEWKLFLIIRLSYSYVDVLRSYLHYLQVLFFKSISSFNSICISLFTGLFK